MFSSEELKRAISRVINCYKSGEADYKWHLGQHRYFLSTDNVEYPWLSFTEVLRKTRDNWPRQSGPDVDAAFPAIVEMGYEIVSPNNHQPAFNDCWESYFTLCKSIGVKPSGGKVKKPKDRTFIRRIEQPLILEGYPQAEDHIPQGCEGAEVQVTSNQYERKPEYRQACVEYFEGKDGRIACQVCDMDFESRYGEIGRGFIHIHHIDPLGDGQGEREIVPTRDLVPVCPNCHAMLHKKPGIGNAYTLEEIRQRLKE